MKALRPTLFDDAKKSHASQNLAVQIAMFAVVFFVILLAESAIPGIMSIGPMKEELEKSGYLENGTFTFAESMSTATKVASMPKIMIPTLFSTVFGTLISILYVRAFEMRKVRSMGTVRRRAVPHYLLGIAVGLLMMTSITMLTVVTGVNGIKVNSDINYGLIALYLGGFLIQGMSEEFIFRGYLMTTVGASHNTWIAIGISAAAFGLAHAANPGFTLFTFFNLALFGAFASLYMILFEDIWGVCAIHSVWNFAQGNIYGISVSGSGDTESVLRTTAISDKTLLTGGKFGIEGSIFTTIVLGVGIAVLLVIMYKRPQNTDSE